MRQFDVFWQMARWNIPCTNKTGKILLFMMYVLFLKITRFLGLTLILHPGHTSLFNETVKIKFMGPRGRGPTYGAEGQGPRKTNTLLKRTFYSQPENCQERFNWKTFITFSVVDYCIKSVCIRRFLGPYFLAFGLNTEIYRENFRIQSECRRIQTRKTLNTDTFYTVQFPLKLPSFFEFSGE